MSEQSSQLVAKRIPVSVMMERKRIQRDRWSFPSWQALGVLVAGSEATVQQVSASSVYKDEHSEQFLWSGFVLELFKDGCESYWYNLMSDKPLLFVVCQQDEDESDEQEPCLVTASADEANAHVEADDTAYSVPMPPEIHQWVERFVVDNYQPEEKKKRKRKDWAKDIR